MADPPPLEGMARSIDALFSDAEKRDDDDADAPRDTAATAERAGAAPDADAAAQHGDADDARVTAEPHRATGHRGRPLDAAVGSADLLDDVDVIVPPSDRRPAGPARSVTIEVDEDLDPAALAEAAAWPAGSRRGDAAGLQDADTLQDADALSDADPLLEDADLLQDADTLRDAPAAAPAAAPDHDAFFVPDALVGPPPTPSLDEPLDASLPDPGTGDDGADAAAGPSSADPPEPAAPEADPTPVPSLGERLAAVPRGPDDVALRARALVEAVTAYQEAEPRRREAAADTVREAVAAQRLAREFTAVADAVERLVLTGDPRAVDLAREITDDAVAGRIVARLGIAREEERRDELLRVIQPLAEVMAPALASALTDESDRSARRNALQALVRLGEPGLRQAEVMVGDSRWFVVRNGVGILGEIGGHRAVAHLTSTLAHEDARVRRETLLALGRIGGEDAGMLAAGKLEDPEAEVRAAAAMAVGALRVERSQRPLQALLETETDEDVLVAVLRALGLLGDPGAVPFIERKAVGSFFSRASSAVRSAAYRALAAIGTPRARQILEAGADDKDPEVKRVVGRLLRDR